MNSMSLWVQLIPVTVSLKYGNGYYLSLINMQLHGFVRSHETYEHKIYVGIALIHISNMLETGLNLVHCIFPALTFAETIRFHIYFNAQFLLMYIYLLLQIKCPETKNRMKKKSLTLPLLFILYIRSSAVDPCK